MTTIYRLNKDFTSRQKNEIDLSALEKLEVGKSIFIPIEDIQFYKTPQKSLKKRVHGAANRLGMVFLIYPERQRGFVVKRTL